MAGTVTTVEEICNLALDKIGWPRSIGSIFSGTREARVALREYSQCRDSLLIRREWDFARQITPLTLQKTAPVGGYGLVGWTSAFPPLPWIYQYAYPTGCLVLLAVRPTPVLIPEYAPRPNVFTLANDPTEPASKVILTNLANAVGVFTGQVTDVTQYDTMFVEALIEELARRFAEGLGSPLEEVKEQMAVADRTSTVAVLGQQ